MKNTLPKQWINNLEILDIAFQPILNIHTGKIFAVEALLRCFKDVGFESIFALFDRVYQENILYSFDIALREKALVKFTKIKDYEKIKLFYNLDNRLFEMPDFSEGNTISILKKLNIKKENICFEISERHKISNKVNFENILKHYQKNNFCIAIDDFGVGYSGYKLLYDSTPNLIKIDRFFLQAIENNPKKRLLVRNITHLAIQLGIKVVAEGVETREELLTAKEIGCHLVQGYFAQRPTRIVEEILDEYEHIVELVKDNRRKKSTQTSIETYLDKTTSICIKTKMNFVIEYFKKNSSTSIVPIVNSYNEPVGILHESQIKEFLYSPFGMSLLLNNESSKSKLKNLVQPCGYTDIHSSISTIIELFSNDPDSVGITITKNSTYYGFLSARAIISIMNEENLILARDQNPLTKLPGNTMIEKNISDSSKANTRSILCYFDLDNFKAFNDVYGFRNGDRVIQFFADLLRKNLDSTFFKGHIGGDDFFASVEYKEKDEEKYLEYFYNIVEKFSDNVREFYSKEDKENGYIISKDRDGKQKKFPLLSVSAAILILHKRTKNRSVENINTILSLEKKVAKKAFKHLSLSSLL